MWRCSALLFGEPFGIKQIAAWLIMGGVVLINQG